VLCTRDFAGVLPSPSGGALAQLVQDFVLLPCKAMQGTLSSSAPQMVQCGVYAVTCMQCGH